MLHLTCHLTPAGSGREHSKTGTYIRHARGRLRSGLRFPDRYIYIFAHCPQSKSDGNVLLVPRCITIETTVGRGLYDLRLVTGR